MADLKQALAFVLRNEGGYAHNPACTILNCSRPYYAKALCKTHYDRQRHSRELESPIKEHRKNRICCEPGCNTLTAKNGGYGRCQKHYKRWLARTRTIELVELLGGQCAGCKESYPSAVFDFHHREPANKSFTISNQIINQPFHKLVAETKKCELLCANCHRLHHYGSDNGVFA